MSRKNRVNKTKHQDQIQNQSGQEKLSSDEVINQLEKKILNECKEIARGTKASIYELIEMSKELMVLEADDSQEPLSEAEF